MAAQTDLADQMLEGMGLDQVADLTSDGAPTGDTAADAAASDDGATPDAKAADADEKAAAGLKSALSAERQKRQQLEQQLAATTAAQQAWIAQQQGQQQQADVFSEDKILEDLPGAFKRQQQALDKRFVEGRLEASEAQAKAMLSDYDEVMNEHYQQACIAMPGLANSVQQSASPAFTAYRAVKDYIDRSQGNSKLSELEAKNKELADKLAALEKKAGIAALPQSMATARGTSTPTGSAAVASSDNLLDDIFANSPL